MNKALKILKQIEAGRLQVGDSSCCACGRRNYCSLHNYAYRRWLENTLPYLQIEAGIRG